MLNLIPCAGKTISLIKGGQGGEKNKENILPSQEPVCLRCGNVSHQAGLIIGRKL
jgi:hypothetical protein